MKHTPDMTVFDRMSDFGEHEAANPNRQDRILDRLGDLLFVADDLLSSEQFDAPEGESIRWIGIEVERIYSAINEMMKKISN